METGFVELERFRPNVCTCLQSSVSFESIVDKSTWISDFGTLVNTKHQLYVADESCLSRGAAITHLIGRFHVEKLTFSFSQHRSSTLRLITAKRTRDAIQLAGSDRSRHCQGGYQMLVLKCVSTDAPPIQLSTFAVYILRLPSCVDIFEILGDIFFLMFVFLIVKAAAHRSHLTLMVVSTLKIPTD